MSIAAKEGTSIEEQIGRGREELAWKWALNELECEEQEARSKDNG